jgi:hypothetical protein
VGPFDGEGLDMRSSGIQAVFRWGDDAAHLVDSVKYSVCVCVCVLQVWAC